MMYYISEFIILLMIAFPSLIFHEIGHVVALRFIHAKIQLTIGIGKLLWVGTAFNIQIFIHRIFFIRFFTSSVRKTSFTSSEKIIVSLMGPAFSLALGSVCYVLFYAFWPASIFYLGFLFNTWIGIVNLLPFKIGQKHSDGYTIYKIFTNKRQ